MFRFTTNIDILYIGTYKIHEFRCRQLPINLLIYIIHEIIMVM